MFNSFFKSDNITETGEIIKNRSFIDKFVKNFCLGNLSHQPQG